MMIGSGSTVGGVCHGVYTKKGRNQTRTCNHVCSLLRLKQSLLEAQFWPLLLANAKQLVISLALHTVCADASLTCAWVRRHKRQ